MIECEFDKWIIVAGIMGPLFAAYVLAILYAWWRCGRMQ